MSLIENKDFRWFVYKDNFLSEDECLSIINKIDNSERIESYSEHSVQLSDEVLKEKYWKLLRLVNTIHYKFDISGIQRDIVYGKRYSHEGWLEEEPHVDFNSGGGYIDSTTKLTCITYLNDDFDGGELQVLNDKIEVKKGRVIIFSSFAAHKVLQFYKNNRYVLVNFAEGNTFK